MINWFKRLFSFSDSHTVDDRIRAIKEQLGIHELEAKHYEMEIAQDLMIASIKLNSERLGKLKRTLEDTQTDLETLKENSRYRGKTSSGLWRVVDGLDETINLRRRKH